VRYVDGIQTDRLRIAFILLQLINRDTQIWLPPLCSRKIPVYEDGRVFLLLVSVCQHLFQKKTSVLIGYYEHCLWLFHSCFLLNRKPVCSTISYNKIHKFLNNFCLNKIPIIEVRIHKRKRLLGRKRHTWEDNIKTYLEEVGWKCVDWIHLAQGRQKRHWIR
jgi:hypothetical protein